ncbi:MAG: hypothetical protein ACI8X5_002531 [Planctomycetota bacterium]
MRGAVSDIRCSVLEVDGARVDTIRRRLANERSGARQDNFVRQSRAEPPLFEAMQDELDTAI